MTIHLSKNVRRIYVLSMEYRRKKRTARAVISLTFLNFYGMLDLHKQ